MHLSERLYLDGEAPESFHYASDSGNASDFESVDYESVGLFLTLKLSGNALKRRTLSAAVCTLLQLCLARHSAAAAASSSSSSSAAAAAASSAY